MKRYKLAVLFTQPPFGSAASREGLDSLLAASAFCDEEELAVCFLFDGVFNLACGQQPEQILQKDHIATFKLIELYELPHCFVCTQSLEERGLAEQPLILTQPQRVTRNEVFNVLRQSEKILTF